MRILVLDDNPNDRVLAARALASEFPGAAFDESVTDRPSFDAAVDAGGFDLVITDFQLKWSDGLKVLRAIKARHPHVPVVMFTGTGSEEVAVEGMKSGLDDYVVKAVGHYLRLSLAARGAMERAKFRAERDRVMEDLRRAKEDAERATAVAERAKEDAERAREEAEAAGRLKDDFLSIVSHELRTPLHTILGWATLLRGGGLEGAEAMHGLEAVERNAKAQARIVDDLLDVSRIVTGRMRLDARPLDLREVVEAALETVRAAADAKGVHLHAALDATVGPVPGDFERLRQVVWNLVSNAVRFTPAGGMVRVTLDRDEGEDEDEPAESRPAPGASPGAARARIVVSDNGQGIAPEFLPHVFDRFRQWETPTTRKHGGLGVGLSIVKHLVELHGGTVTARSGGPGEGATFVVLLPLAPSASRPADAGAARPPAPMPPSRAPSGEEPFECPAAPLAGVRVLVVDDEEDARVLLRMLLTECEAEVAVAGSAAEAEAALHRVRPHVLVSDIGMPGRDGYDLIRRLRAAERRGGAGPAAPALPAVALTAVARPEDRRRSILAGFQLHLPKPVDAMEFVAAVANLAASARAGRE